MSYSQLRVVIRRQGRLHSHIFGFGRTLGNPGLARCDICMHDVSTVQPNSVFRNFLVKGTNRNKPLVYHIYTLTLISGTIRQTLSDFDFLHLATICSIFIGRQSLIDRRITFRLSVVSPGILFSTLSLSQMSKLPHSHLLLLNIIHRKTLIETSFFFSSTSYLFLRNWILNIIRITANHRKCDKHNTICNIRFLIFTVPLNAFSWTKQVFENSSIKKAQEIVCSKQEICLLISCLIWAHHELSISNPHFVTPHHIIELSSLSTRIYHFTLNKILSTP